MVNRHCLGEVDACGCIKCMKIKNGTKLRMRLELLEMSIRKWETYKLHQKNSSGGSPRSEHADSGGKSPLVSVKHSERGRLTSKCGYLPAWKTL